jgi:hypothetical protein
MCASPLSPRHAQPDWMGGGLVSRQMMHAPPSAAIFGSNRPILQDDSTLYWLPLTGCHYWMPHLHRDGLTPVSPTSAPGLCQWLLLCCRSADVRVHMRTAGPCRSGLSGPGRRGALWLGHSALGTRTARAQVPKATFMSLVSASVSGCYVGAE